MPTANRREFMKAKVKYEYRKCKAETNPEKIAFLLQFAELSVENARCHREGLIKAFGGGGLGQGFNQ